MATYKSRFKGSQVDEAVTIANSNKNKGSVSTPIFYDADGYGQAIEKDTAPTVSSVKPLISGGAYGGLDAVVDYSDIQWEKFNGEFIKEGSLLIDDGIAGIFSNANYLTMPTIDVSKPFELEVKIKLEEYPPEGQAVVAFMVDGSVNKRFGLLFAVNNFGKLMFNTSSNGTSFIGEAVGTTTLSLNTWYYAKLIYNGSAFTSYLSSDGINYNQEATSTRDAVYNGLGVYRIGRYHNSAQWYFRGYIDLKELKIYVDNKPAYTPYPQSSLPPSQGAVKNYVDAEATLEQDQLYGGYGIDVNGATVSVSDDVFREGEEERLHEDLKVDHFGDMNVDNDSEMLGVMDEMKHSTFDRSKFTVVGSPVITDDGILSNCSNTNYCYYNTINFTSTSTVRVYSRVRIPDTRPSGTVAYYTLGIKYGIWFVPSGALRFGPRANNQYTAFTPALGTEYDLIGEWTVGGKFYLYYKKVGENSYTKVGGENTWATETSYRVNFGYYYYSSADNSYLIDGSLDLKQFSITVDGVEVFSGNKTGIDTIKPDDYTVVGTPTISADGIASGFSNDNRITLSNVSSYDFSKPFVIESEFTFTEIASNAQYIYALSVSNTNDGRYGLAFDKENTGVFNVLYTVDGTSWLTISFAETPVTNVLYKVQQIFDGTQMIGKLYKNGVLIELINGGSYSGVSATLNYGSIGSRNVTNSHNSLDTGSIDLNSFKIYVDGNLVYQPCLKIPYTQTKDGKKIVNSYYRERVQDEYDQAGYTPYYTLQPLDQVNYTVVGSPTISSDWIASGFSTSSYIDSGFSFRPGNKTWKMFINFKTGSNVNTEQEFLTGLGAENDCASLGVKNGYLVTWLSSTGSSWDILSADTVISVSTNTEYLISWEWTGTQYIWKQKVNGSWETLKTLNSTQAVYGSATNYVLGNNRGTSSPFAGSIDLKAFKVYIDNELVYIATPNYTLATVEENDMVDGYLNGSTAYTQRASQMLEIQGSCTANTAVTFPNSKAFMDTNYALSVPYSAKTKTGFTPTQTGDYIAEGYTSL